MAEIATVGAGVTTYQNTGLTASTGYSYRVRAYNAAGTSDNHQHGHCDHPGGPHAASDALTGAIRLTGFNSLDYYSNPAYRPQLIITLAMRRLNMSRNRLNALFSAALLMLATAACQDAPVAPGGVLTAAGTPSFSNGGNSAAAHACQQGGYQELFRTDGTGFANAGECVSYAARGGVLARRLTATLTDVSFSACNALTWGYDLDGVQHDFESKAFGCEGFVAASDQSVTFLSTQTLRVFLRDDTCSDTYFEDGNHALVTGSNPWLIQITDSGGFCESDPTMPRPPGDRGNLDVTKTIS